MFTAVLLIMFHGAAPEAMVPKLEQPFTSRSACDEWAAQEARRIERVIETLDEDKRPEQWEIKCVPAVKPVES
jgi:hypothetical protein